MPQEAVDALFDNGRHGRAIFARERALKSLVICSRENRKIVRTYWEKSTIWSFVIIIVWVKSISVYSKKMALILFEPFIIRRLKELGFVHTVVELVR